MSDFSRRSLITGLVAFMVAPAIVRAGSLMPIKQMILEPPVSLAPYETIDWLEEWRIPVTITPDGKIEFGEWIPCSDHTRRGLMLPNGERA